MRVNDFAGQTLKLAATGLASGQPSEPAPDTGSRTDEVELSPLSRALADPGKPDVRVETLRFAVARGSYFPSAQELARHLVDFHLAVT
jgi:anti-sigma28 factor (negative regulator of flagellin synthesis)